MRVFIIGLPNSGRTTIASVLSDTSGYLYVDAMSSMKTVYSNNFPKENNRSDTYHNFITEGLASNPGVYSSHILNVELTCNSKNMIIDGIFSPKDFTHLFNYNTDMVVFLNRLDNDVDHKDYETIGLSVIRDYCFWLSSAGLLSKNKWLEYNFKIGCEDSDTIKTLGSKNTVYIVKSIGNVIIHLQERLNEIS